MPAFVPKETVKSYLVILGQIIAGLLILVSLQQIRSPWLPSPVILFLAFLLLNIVQVPLFKLSNALKEFWSVRRSGLFLLGTIGGMIIALCPVYLAYKTGKINKIYVDTDISLSAAALTLLVVSWEELWFRGLFLNYCHRSLSPAYLSFLMGFLFMIIHALNPAIHLIQTGPSLFFAGALLTLLYFYYKSIWLPLGLHFGNNFTAMLFRTNQDQDLWFGSEGYIQTVILAIIFFVFLVKTKKSF